MSLTTGQIETEAAIYSEGTQCTRADSPTEQIRYSADGSICMVWSGGEPLRCPTQDDMNSLPVGSDMTDEEINQLEG